MSKTPRRVLGAVVVATLLLGPSVVGAQTIHVLLVGDTTANGIAKGVAVDLQNIESAFRTCVPKEHLVLETLSGNRVSRANIVSMIQNVDARKDDGLVFFWSGHGAHDEKGHFLLMPDQTRFYRSDVVNVLRKRGAGSDTLLTSSCNVFVSLVPAPSAYEAKLRTEIAPLFKSLFLRSRGLADINGASEGEYGFSHPTLGTSFFMPLHLYLLANADREMTWNTFVSEMKPMVQKLFEEWYPNGYKDENSKTIQKTQTLRVYHLPPGWPKLDHGDGARFGVQLGDNDGDGVLVARVFSGYPADTAQVAPGDVVLSVNGQTVNTPDEMVNAVARSPRLMRFTTRSGRTGRIRDLTATLRD